MTANLPSVQQAWRIIRKGAPAKALILDLDFPVPTKIPAGEILVKVQAAALNPVYVTLILAQKLVSCRLTSLVDTR